MRLTAPFPRSFGLAVLLAMAGFAAVGYFSIRRDVENLRVISQDNILWTATQMEVELLRFTNSVADVAIERTPEALAAMQERFDILWSRTFMMEGGRVGEVIRRYDEGHDTLKTFGEYLHDLDGVLAGLDPSDVSLLPAVLSKLEEFQKQLRLYTLRVVRGDSAASAAVRDQIQRSAQTTTVVSLAAVLLSLLSFGLIIRENRRQTEIAALNQRIATEAEQASRAKSRFLTMMSHELRNPLNGVLGPLALLGQSDLGPRHRRMVEQAKHAGQSMLQMLSGLLDYGEMQDGRFRLRAEPFRLPALAERVRADLALSGAEGVKVTYLPTSVELMQGDLDRLRQIFVHLAEYVLEVCAPESVEIEFRHDTGALIGDIRFPAEDAAMDWKVNLLVGLNESRAADQVTTEVLRPLIAGGVIAAAQGVLTLADASEGTRAIRVTIPAPPVRYDSIRVHLETRSTALAAIYRAALRSPKVVFADGDAPGTVDMVLVDATSVSENALMGRLRARFPHALFVSLGSPDCPEGFDDVVDVAGDMSGLRTSVLGRLAS
jgi:signal transduction histidine kinase